MNRSEQAEFTNMCMVYDGDGNILVLNRQGKAWPGITFPGGHVEKGESFHDSVVREIKEETGLTIKNPILCGVKQFQTKEDARYIVLLYKTKEYEGELVSSKEGEVFWIPKKDLHTYSLAFEFDKMYEVFESDSLSEFYSEKKENGWEVHLY